MKKYNYRVVFDATITATDKGRSRGWTDRVIHNVVTPWCKSPETALSKLFGKISVSNRRGYTVFTVTNYRIECRDC